MYLERPWLTLQTLRVQCSNENDSLAPSAVIRVVEGSNDSSTATFAFCMCDNPKVQKDSLVDLA